MMKKPQKDEIKDEPGAEERFDRILKRALTTPPKRKSGSEKKEKPKRHP
jgi:hypothetical protein